MLKACFYVFITLCLDYFKEIYLVVLFMTFFMIPFAYFYAQEEQEDIYDIDYIPITQSEKISNSLKKTVICYFNTIIDQIYFIVAILVLLLIGLYFRPGRERGIQKGKEIEWVQKIFDTEHTGEHAISFCLACLTSVGTSFWVIYGGYGLGTLPIFMIKGKKSLQDTKHELNLTLDKVRTKTRAIQEKYKRQHQKISRNDQRLLNSLKRKQRKLSVKNRRIEKAELSFGSIQKIMVIITPFRWLLGVFCLSMSSLIYVSLCIVSYDRLYNSKCGFSCGYVLENPNFINPIDWILVHFSYIFPLDYIIFVVLVSYIFICVLYGIIRLGIKFLCFTVRSFKHWVI